VIVVKLAGGMGNQMFQYAAGRYLSEKHQTALKLDLRFLLDRTPRMDFSYRDYDLDLFSVQGDIAKSDEIVEFGKYRKVKRVLHFFQQKINPNLPVYVRENPCQFDPRFFKIPAHAYIEGYWQSEKYFKQIEPIIRREFVFRDAFDEKGIDMARRISAVNAVCLNVRRGDYVSNPIASQHHGVCELNYFTNAVSIIASKVPNPHFFIFSDDFEWCRSNMHLDYPCTIVGDEYGGRKFGQKLHLMTKCKHFIIPNSSFGWWAAWLNTSSDKLVIAPARWCREISSETKGILPAEWISI
jgi:hypothetical protein